MGTDNLLSYLLSLGMGFTLGLFGGGGSILSVPIFVYVVGISPVLSTAYSLFVVGTSAAVGTINKHFKGEIAYKIGIYFALPSILAVYATRRFIMPTIPESLGTYFGFNLTKDLGLMLFFALVMLVASVSMIKGRKERASVEKSLNIPLIILEGIVVGLITGLVGAGGGFLIVPALVLLVGLSMKKAVATSLLIIALKSLIGFTGDLSSGLTFDWPFLLTFTSFAIVGMLLGLIATKKIDSSKLKKLFGYFILAMAVFILYIELF
jgi:uncharacterized membrane protein YfcA